MGRCISDIYIVFIVIGSILMSKSPFSLLSIIVLSPVEAKYWVNQFQFSYGTGHSYFILRE